MKPPTVLIVTNLAEQNVNQLIPHLERRGLRWFRLNTEAFPLATAIQWNIAGKEVWASLETAVGEVDTRYIKAVWYRRPVPPVSAAGLTETESHFADTECRALLTGLISTLHSPWMNDPAAEDRATDKLYQLTVASSLHLAVPRTLVTNDPTHAREFFDECDEQVLFKTVSGGAWLHNSNADELVRAYGPRLVRQPAIPQDDTRPSLFLFSQLLTRDRLPLLDHIQIAPVMFQQFIKKRCDVRITIVGDAIFACRILSQERPSTRVDFRRFVNVPTETPHHQPFTLPPQIERSLRALMRRLGLRFGCIDMIVTEDDRYVFLEVNAAGQWGWIEQLTGMQISEAIADELARLATNGLAPTAISGDGCGNCHCIVE
ncbi:MAG: hypothetical protein K2Y37_01285 [Pirellulales bacterium]|nr:hypothetical protein [Pirellulales bacterium]